MIDKVGPIGRILFRGVLIESRYGEVDELHYMQMRRRPVGRGA